VGSIKSNSNTLPWWTWVVPFVLFHGGSRVSLFFQYDLGVASLYLPAAMGLVLINWWGPWRILPALYLNAVVCTPFWGVSEVPSWFLYALPETAYVFLSWFIFSKHLKGDYALSNNLQFSRFLFFGLFIPLVVEVLLLDVFHVINMDQTLDNFQSNIAHNFIGEFAAAFGFSVPALYFATPYLQRWRLLAKPVDGLYIHQPLRGKRLIEAMFFYIATIALSFVLSFEQYWFVYGLFALYLANRFGFGAALFANLLSITFTYIIPVMALHANPEIVSHDLVPISIGNSLLFVFAAITGRVISDVRLAERKLLEQNHELEVTNKKLDRFVYSVSHDLASPLKSILGLINISRMETDLRERMDYLSKMESSVKKLENFISEVLDYSRVNRVEVRAEAVRIKELCEEILQQLPLPQAPDVEIDLSGVTVNEIKADRVRTRIILNNLLSNALKFRRPVSSEPHRVTVRAVAREKQIELSVIDNGEGIRPEHQPRIFEMFYRASSRNTGSGLGLYIAKEAVEKMGGSITLESNYGVGTRFIVQLPLETE
jgi:signal transduction histidine kinase